MPFLTPPSLRRPGLVVRHRLGDPMDLLHGMSRLLGDPSCRGPELVPRVDVQETAEAVHVVAELPGVALEDVELTLEEGVLVLKGEKRAPEVPEAEGQPQRSVTSSERTFGPFERHVALPAEVDDAEATARFRAGVLEVTLPRAAVVETTRRIEIRSGE